MDIAELISGLVILAIIIALIIFMFVKVLNLEKVLATEVAEIKSKIGSIIREVNRINHLEYKIDVNQQKDINNLKDKSFVF